MILDGRIVKEKILNELKEKIDALDEELTLAVIEVGDNPASRIYINQKKKMTDFLGINFKHIKLEENIKEEEILNIINDLNNDDKVDGILVQMPLPSHINASKVQNTINEYKDVDGLTDINIGKLAHNNECLIACTPSGILELLKYYNIEITGKNVTIVGRSSLVGKPLALLLENNNATVTICHSKTKDLKKHTKNADILVVAVGHPNLITKYYIKENAIIIDVGINRLEDNKICGDVDFEGCKDKGGYITPVPGGVGQMTIASLGLNIYKAHMLRKGK